MNQYHNDVLLLSKKKKSKIVIKLPCMIQICSTYNESSTTESEFVGFVLSCPLIAQFYKKNNNKKTRLPPPPKYENLPYTIPSKYIKI